jgi:hypothetical protein
LQALRLLSFHVVRARQEQKKEEVNFEAAPELHTARLHTVKHLSFA